MALIDKLPATDARAMHALGEGIDRSEEGAFDTFVDTARAYLSARLDDERDPARLARVAEAWATIERSRGEVATYNLDRKPLVFTVFGLLAEVARG
jgi:DNA polymerase-3 subunit delta'